MTAAKRLGGAFMFLPFVVLAATAAVIVGGIYLTLRGFKASEARANGGAASGPDPSRHHHHVSRHDHATNELLKRFFDGKACGICKRAIPPIPRTGLKPGLLDPSTHDTHSWDEIPNDNTAATLDGKVPLCPACQVAESFRHRFPDHVTDRDRSLQGAQTRPV